MRISISIKLPHISVVGHKIGLILLLGQKYGRLRNADCAALLLGNSLGYYLVANQHIRHFSSDRIFDRKGERGHKIHVYLVDIDVLTLYNAINLHRMEYTCANSLNSTQAFHQAIIKQC